MTTIDERFAELHPSSMTISQVGGETFPDGVTHDGRRLEPFRVYMDRGLGSRKWDIDGNEYVDYWTGHGSMILGHSHPEVVKAVTEQMAKGTHLSASTELEVKWASLVKQLVPCAEKVRFVASGTEAIMMTFRMARAYTGETKIVRFDKAFHGWADGPFVGAENDNLDNGIPQVERETMVVLPYDIGAVERALDDGDVAAVIFQCNQVVEPSFAEHLRDLTEQKGVLLIFDEVVSGFRWSRGGFQGRFNITPDLCGMAKVLAGGLPGAGVAGRADIIDTIAKDKIYHPGTFNANPLSAAAGSTALSIVAVEPITDIVDANAERLKAGLNDLLTRLEVPGCAYGVSSIVHMRLGVDHECDHAYCSADGGGYAKPVVDLIHRGLINEGVWSRPDTFILSAAHSDADIDRTLEAYEGSLQQARAEGAI